MFLLCLSMSVCVTVHHVCSVLGGQKRDFDFWEMKSSWNPLPLWKTSQYS